MGQTLALASVLGLAAGAYKALSRLQSLQGFRDEPRHAPGSLEAVEDSRHRGASFASATPDGAASTGGGSEPEGAKQPAEVRVEAVAEPEAEAGRQAAETSARQQECSRIVGELRALREQAERMRLERRREEQDRYRQVKMKEALQREGEIREAARRRYPRPAWLSTKDCINVAVTGNAGVGKSSFINTVRGLRPRDPGAADVSPNETTMEPKWYEFPDLSVATRLWDLPGAGTQRFPRETYIQSMGLRYFDIVIIVTATRYTETEVMIAEELRSFSVPHFMVRNKVDADIANNQDDHGLTADSTLDSMREDMKKQGVRQPYLVSSKIARKAEFDMEKLKADAIMAICEAREVPEAWLQPSLSPQAVGGVVNIPTPARAVA